MTHDPSVRYRPDIDGLRALAILPVVWFHSGLPGLPGGFTGVDTFFVISGYLITLIIHREVMAGQFSFARFYERRVRRIAPALVVVLAATTLGAFYFQLPYELEDFGWSAIAATAMVSNLYFWLTGGYFALADQSTPLLHSWSLGVEEQFYLIFPTALVLFARFRVTKAAIVLLLVLSFALCIYATSLMPGASFYLLPTRGWELMLGAALATGAVTIPKRFASLAGVMGIALLIGAAVLIEEGQPFPGWRAAIPAVGATLIIGAGPQFIAGRILSLSPMVWVGRISYSLYLWHWPIFAFLREWCASGDLPAVYSLGGMALAGLLSGLTYRWIEQPARRSTTPFRSVLAAIVAPAALVLFAAVAAIVGRGLPQRLSPQVLAVAAHRDAYAPQARSCLDTSLAYAQAHCRLGPAGDPAFVLWGDSHSAAIEEGVAQGLRVPGLQLSQSNCPPTISWFEPRSVGRDHVACVARNREALELIEATPSVKTVVLSANWAAREDSGGIAFWNDTQRLVDTLGRGGRKVVLIAGIPLPGSDAPWSDANRTRFGRPLIKLTCKRERIPIRRAIIVDVSGGFCGRKAYEMFTDDNHISRKAGLEIVAPAIRASMLPSPQ